MHDSIADLLPDLDQALADCAGVVDLGDLEPIAGIRDRIEARLRRPEDVLIAGLAGGTGSGKSSLFNAIAGDELAAAGGTRPTTSKPLALIPMRWNQALAGYLADAGIEDRIVGPGPEWLCLIDLPDTDSIEVEHRLTVDGLLPRIDVVVWVVDPEKYRDASLHRGLVAPLASYQSQFVFVLNQADRLSPDDAEAVSKDLGFALDEDGLDQWTIIPVAARPAAGPPWNIEALVAHLRAMLDSGAAHTKLVSDLEDAVSLLSSATGPGGGVDFEARWSRLMEDLEREPEGRGLAVAAFLDDLADEVTGPASARLRELADMAPSKVLDDPPPEPGKHRRRRWLRAVPDSTTEPKRSSLAASLEVEVGSPVRVILGDRARAQATIAKLALEVQSLAHRSA